MLSAENSGCVFVARASGAMGKALWQTQGQSRRGRAQTLLEATVQALQTHSLPTGAPGVSGGLAGALEFLNDGGTTTHQTGEQEGWESQQEPWSWSPGESWGIWGWAERRWLGPESAHSGLQARGLSCEYRFIGTQSHHSHVCAVVAGAELGGRTVTHRPGSVSSWPFSEQAC